MSKKQRTAQDKFKLVFEPLFYLFDGNIYREIKQNETKIILLNLTNDILYIINIKTLYFLKSFNTIEEAEKEARQIDEYEPTAYRKIKKNNKMIKMSMDEHPTELNGFIYKKLYDKIKKYIQKQRPANPDNNYNYAFNIVSNTPAYFTLRKH